MENSLGCLHPASGGGGGGVHQPILGGGVPPGLPNPDPISDPEMSSSTPTTPFGAAQTYMAKIREYPSPPVLTLEGNIVLYENETFTKTTRGS